MSIGSRRTREKEQNLKQEVPIKTETIAEKEIVIPIKEIVVEKQEPIKEVKKVVIEEQANDAVNELKTAIVKETAPIVIEKVELETIQKVTTKKRKEREDKKTFNNVGIVGDTIEVRDFRAIVKKQGKQINTVLTEILNGWNMANYNL
jgi:hypothetical protein